MRQLVVVALVLLVGAGCGGDAPRAVDEDGRAGADADVSNAEIADYLARETKLNSDQATALVSTQDAGIRPTREFAGWREHDDGMWMRQYEGRSAFVTVASYAVGHAPDLTARALLVETKRQLRQFSETEPVFRTEDIGERFRRTGVARLDYASVSPGGRDIEHVQYVMRIGARVYNVVGGAQTAIWPDLRPEIERFIASFDFEHPVPSSMRVPPGMAGATDDDVQPLFAGASTREVQDAVATWTHTPGDGGKPWFPSLIRCDEPSSRVPDEWQCTIDFMTPDGSKRDVDVIIAASASGRWTASLCFRSEQYDRCAS